MKTQNDVETVLLVEDTEDNRFMMRRLLEMSGYRVVEARNGEEAVRTAEAQEPKLILMDLSLPLIDGLAATRLPVGERQSLRFPPTTAQISIRRLSRRAAIATLQSPSIFLNSKN
jgi:CheY-like chemotaxis protein